MDLSEKTKRVYDLCLEQKNILQNLKSENFIKSLFLIRTLEIQKNIIISIPSFKSGCL